MWFGDRDLRRGNWGQGTWDRELGQGTGARELGAAKWGQGTWDRELGHRELRPGHCGGRKPRPRHCGEGTGAKELGTGNWGAGHWGQGLELFLRAAQRTRTEHEHNCPTTDAVNYNVPIVLRALLVAFFHTSNFENSTNTQKAKCDPMLHLENKNSTFKSHETLGKCSPMAELCVQVLNVMHGVFV